MTPLLVGQVSYWWDKSPTGGTIPLLVGQVAYWWDNSPTGITVGAQRFGFPPRLTCQITVVTKPAPCRHWEMSEGISSALHIPAVPRLAEKKGEEALGRAKGEG